MPYKQRPKSNRWNSRGQRHGEVQNGGREVRLEESLSKAAEPSFLCSAWGIPLGYVKSSYITDANRPQSLSHKWLWSSNFLSGTGAWYYGGTEINHRYLTAECSHLEGKQCLRHTKQYCTAQNDCYEWHRECGVRIQWEGRRQNLRVLSLTWYVLSADLLGTQGWSSC